MIAASEPQEFIPSGRQLVERHPGPSRSHSSTITACNVDAFVVKRLEKVSLSEEFPTEWWIIRQCKNYYDDHIQQPNETDKIPEKNTNEESWSWKTIDPNMSGKTPHLDRSSRVLNRSKFSSGSEMFTSRTSSRSSKSGNNVTFKSTELKCKKSLPVMEEELYVRGCTAVWSRGLISTGSQEQFGFQRTTICSYTTDSPIKHALWCTFYSEWIPFIYEELWNRPDEPIGNSFNCICLIDSDTIRAFADTGEDFRSNLPFQVTNVWSSKYGIVLEREPSVLDTSTLPDFDAKHPHLYSLNHPLDEMSPIIFKFNSYMNNASHKVVFVSTEPSIVLAYDVTTGQHSIYLYRRLRLDEWNEVSVRSKLSHSLPSSTSVSQKVKQTLSIFSGHGAGLPLASASPCTSRATSFSSPVSSSAHSPMAQISRCQSPCASPFYTGSGWLNRCVTTHESFPLIQTDYTSMKQTINPQFCLEHIWSEPVKSSGRGDCYPSAVANKAFLCDDLVGQRYIAYLIPTNNQLALVRMDLSNNNRLIFGTMYSLTAKDAVVVPDLHMLAILEPMGHVQLYSGPVRIAKVHVGGVSAELGASPGIARFKSPFPRRSSLLPHATDTPRFDEHLLSPVHPAADVRRMLHSTLLTTDHSLAGLLDNVGDRFTLRYSDGTYHRVSLPPLASSPLVHSCLNVLRQVLPRDTTLMLLSRWYAERNAPGPSDLTTDQEWRLFSDLLLNLLGFGVGNGDDRASTPDEAKRQRPSPQGSQSDWDAFLHSEQNTTCSADIDRLLGLQRTPISTSTSSSSSSSSSSHRRRTSIDSSSELFVHHRLVLTSLHLLYEELKLYTTRLCELPSLCGLLHHLASALGLKSFVIHYWKDYPELCDLQWANDVISVLGPLPMGLEPADVLRQLHQLLTGGDMEPYPYIQHVNERSRQIIKLVGASQGIQEVEELVKRFVPPGTRVDVRASTSTCRWQSSCERVVALMVEMRMTRRDLDGIPGGASAVLHEALWACRAEPPADWPAEAYLLVQRPELAARVNYGGDEARRPQPNSNVTANACALRTGGVVEGEVDDGMGDIENAAPLRLRFPEDRRTSEVRRCLRSSEPVEVRVTQRPEVSDHDFIEEQERHLLALCARTMALPIGRGMLTLRTVTPVATEPLGVPRLCLSGRAPPRGAAVELAHVDAPANMNQWPLFHNGAAAGLRVNAPVDSAWISYNKPRAAGETAQEHAGFLLALGLNAQLRGLACTSAYEYLTRGHELTSVGLLLGMAASHRGTMNSNVARVLALHVEGLLPPTAIELDVPQNVQVSALLGFGLLYEGCGHRRTAEALLTEMGRPPGPEMDNSSDRESYALAAGLALGLVCLKSGAFADDLAGELRHLMLGGARRPPAGSQRDKYRVPSFQVREGATVNLDVTAPGATLALALAYLGSGNHAVADWMAPPSTLYLFDSVRPDLLLLRVCARALVLWDEVRPTSEWVEQQVPSTVRRYCLARPAPHHRPDVDYEAANQAYCNIAAGSCLALGLRYAGTGDERAIKTLLLYCRVFASLTGKSIAELAGRPTVETCLQTTLLAAATVAAGSGRLDVLRLCRRLRSRVGPAAASVVTYGSHLATHMAIGLLFLGGGRYALSNSPPAVAALLCALFPKFPTHSNDNRYHLQAFRHLYVLAAQPRLLLPRDVSTSRLCYANLQIIRLDGIELQLKAPCLLPELDGLARIAVTDDRYWPVAFERGRNWDRLLLLLRYGRYIELKRRSKVTIGDDPADAPAPWLPLPEALRAAHADPSVRLLADLYMASDPKRPATQREITLRDALGNAVCECAITDRLAALPVWIGSLIDSTTNASHHAHQIWQLRLLFAASERGKNSAVPPTAALGLKQRLSSQYDRLDPEMQTALQNYISGDSVSTYTDLPRLANYITLYDIPFKLQNNIDNDPLNIISTLVTSGFSDISIDRLLRLLYSIGS